MWTANQAVVKSVKRGLLLIRLRSQENALDTHKNGISTTSVHGIDVINVYNVYKKFFVNAFIILSTFISIKIT